MLLPKITLLVFASVVIGVEVDDAELRKLEQTVEMMEALLERFEKNGCLAKHQENPEPEDEEDSVKNDDDIDPENPPPWYLPRVPNGILMWLSARAPDLLIPLRMSPNVPEPPFRFTDPSDPLPIVTSESKQVQAPPLQTRSCPLRPDETGEEGPFGKQPEWPRGFGDRLSVIKFDYIIDPETGQARAPEDDTANAVRTACEYLLPLDICGEPDPQTCDGLIVSIGPRTNCHQLCRRKQLYCLDAWDDEDTEGCPTAGLIDRIGCDAAPRRSQVCRCSLLPPSD
ncbi:hypothetical protein FOL47_002665 [Perkinsus chesapeaki]|uniref:Uncharacterized protein n=1 Tax=Perkinsus chesapeaki TaxID=330153 RepID=A0A7J6MCD8_PERCH|nr:hypothetical protein FOL47_002665 [Perkinsus chesapeaki]